MEKKRAAIEGKEEKGPCWNRKKANNRDEGFRASLPTFLPSAVRMLRVSYEKKEGKKRKKKGSRYERDNLISAI